eukprot:CAMPEP_0195045834 /NCGR_PEP_ID=MMETSP0347-20130606/18878_1 /TAXON_ID=2932 /ORGANISM="Alexandrium fundyense, Strain CCMP1719" /LENGTH=69 /DNA_ID=CAMNT_0040073737 /DNA_START=93 /DNA_END=299 /DNA_ORIENTATION=-
MHMIMKQEKTCPNGGVGTPSSIKHGVQLKTKMNIEDSNELAINPQNSTCFFSMTTLSPSTKFDPLPVSW